MRARRHFQPSLDSLPMRLAPSNVGVMVSPMSPVAGSSSSPPAIISPMNPASGPDSGPSDSDPTAISPGSYTPPPASTLPC